MFKVKESSDFGKWLEKNKKHSLHLEKGKMLHLRDFHQAFWVREGRVLLRAISPNGRLITLEILKEAVLCGEVPGSKKMYCKLLLEALHHSLIITVDQATLEGYLREHPEVLAEFVLNQINWLIETRERLSDYLTLGVSAKTALLLLEFQDKYGRRSENGATVIEEQITHKILADFIGAARENVTIFLNQLEEEGIIVKKRCCITLLQPERLKQYIC